MARSFNGTSDYIEADGGGVFGVNSDFSVSFWVKVPALASSSSTDFVCYSEGNSGSASYVFSLMSLASSSLTNLRVFIKGTSPTTNYSQMGTLTVWDNTWHNVVFSHSHTRGYSFYVDGALDTSTSHGSWTTTVNDLTFGVMKRSTLSNYFPGALAEVANWTRTLTPGEAALLASGLPASHLAPAHYWPLWGSDSPEPDLGNVSHATGTLTGTAFASGGKVGSGLLVVGG